jgi:hypothetical protein
MLKKMQGARFKVRDAFHLRYKTLFLSLYLLFHIVVSTYVSFLGRDYTYYLERRLVPKQVGLALDIVEAATERR